MIATTEPKPAQENIARPDSFPYGYRLVFHTLPDGRTITDRIPLTLKDVLHPELGDVLMEGSMNEAIRRYLADAFSERLAHDPTALVLSDCGVYWDDPELDHHSPDISVIFGVRAKKEDWTSFFVAKEGVRPRLLLEVVSPKSRENDVITKVDHYQRARVPWYIIVDRENENSPLTLIGYMWTPTEYLPMPKDGQGRLWLEPLGLWLGIKDNKVVCYDGVTGGEIGDYQRIFQQLEAETARAEAEKARAEAEKARAEAAEARLRELESELARRNQHNP
jgi:Uma2 family endonuclease